MGSSTTLCVALRFRQHDPVIMLVSLVNLPLERRLFKCLDLSSPFMNGVGWKLETREIRMSTPTFIVHCVVDNDNGSGPTSSARRTITRTCLVHIHRLSLLPRLVSHVVTINRYEKPRRLPCLFVQCHGHGELELYIHMEDVHYVRRTDGRSLIARKSAGGGRTCPFL